MTLVRSSPERGQGVLGANLLCMGSMMVWAAGLPAADVLIPLLPPLALAAARMALATAVLLPIWLILEPRAALGANWLMGLLVGGLLGFGAACLVIGQGMTSAVTVAIISTTMPIVGALIEAVLDRRRPSGALLAGIALSLTGGYVALDPAAGGPDFGLGALVMLASLVVYALASRLTVSAFPALTPLGRTTITLTTAAMVTALAASIFGAEPAQWSHLDAHAWGALAVFAVGGLALSQLLWILGLGRLGLAQSSLHLNATPFYVMLILFALGGSWVWREAAGAAIVGLGVLVAQNILTFRKT
ncbi:DMT family transporter [Frigidibacter sp. SD6-1]|uniref:DMT family transporter n=1 Tax=Frigidibacter sp. SD6-1 TaxID=3032581 RepID=UPI0024DF784B|nr:DMT family transporter [Frigidibacter sp. SD6-1]